MARRTFSMVGLCDHAAPVKITPPDNNQDNEAATRFVDASFLAKKYNCSSRYILMLAAKDRSRIPCLRLGRKCVRFSEQAVAAVLEGGTK